MDLLLSKGVVDSHSLHKVFHSFPKVVLNERTSIAIEITIVDNIKSTIQVGRHIPKVILLDTCAQSMILKVQFAKKMGCSTPNYENLWQIRTASGSVEEVLRENSDLNALNFNGGTDQELSL